jgi:hypothetical protein
LVQGDWNTHALSAVIRSITYDGYQNGRKLIVASGLGELASTQWLHVANDVKSITIAHAQDNHIIENSC